ncbi:MAG: hypothetical protein P4M12_12950 [Gammaproteobacteria bacterium]|nr:hypothetical protein [Gammaproteobacteria bacterium]
MSKLKCSVLIITIAIMLSTFFALSFAADKPAATPAMSADDFTKKVQALDTAMQDKLKAQVAQIAPKREAASATKPGAKPAAAPAESPAPTPAAAAPTPAPAAPAEPNQPYTGFQAPAASAGTDTSSGKSNTQLNIQY